MVKIPGENDIMEGSGRSRDEALEQLGKLSEQAIQGLGNWDMAES